MRSSFTGVRSCENLVAQAMHVGGESRESCIVRCWCCAYHQIACRHGLEWRVPLVTREFAQPAFEAIARDGRVFEPRDDDADAGMMQKGSEDPHLED